MGLGSAPAAANIGRPGGGHARLLRRGRRPRMAQAAASRRPGRGPAPPRGLPARCHRGLRGGVPPARQGRALSLDPGPRRVCERDAAGDPSVSSAPTGTSAAPAEIDNLQKSERLWRFCPRRPWRCPLGLERLQRRDLRQPFLPSIIGLCGNRPVRGNDIWPERLHPADLRRAMAVFDAHPRAEADRRRRVPPAVRGRQLSLGGGAGKVMERNASGKALRMTGTVRDVHDRHLAIEREKRRSRSWRRPAASSRWARWRPPWPTSSTRSPRSAISAAWCCAGLMPWAPRRPHPGAAADDRPAGPARRRDRPSGARLRPQGPAGDQSR